jgi:hypothetical protein
MNKFRKENNPRGYWGTEETGWSRNKRLLIYIAENRYPDFEGRRDTFTREMQIEVMRIYNMFNPEDRPQDQRQVNLPLREALNKRTEGFNKKFDDNDREYIKYKKELNNK